MPTQRCTVHKHRNLLVHAPQRLHDEVSSDYNDMIYATSAAEIAVRRRPFIRKWRLKCKAVADSLEEAGERLFTFTRLPISQWKSARTTDEIDKPFFAGFARVILQPLLSVEGTVASDNRPWGSRGCSVQRQILWTAHRHARRNLVGVVLSPCTGDRGAKSKSDDESLAAQP